MNKVYSPQGQGIYGGTIAFRDSTVTNSVETMLDRPMNLYKALINNPCATIVYFNMWDVESATVVTPGVTPITRQIPIPINGMSFVDYDPPACFTKGCKYNASTNVDGTGAPGSTVILSSAEYFG
jgi:hypothetical protein